MRFWSLSSLLLYDYYRDRENKIGSLLRQTITSYGFGLYKNYSLASSFGSNDNHINIYTS
jgi:hypothetical protein